MDLFDLTGRVAVVTGGTRGIGLMMDRGLSSVGGRDGVLAQPGLALTPAGQNKRVVAMDDLLLLGFGPRTGQAILELARALHP